MKGQLLFQFKLLRQCLFLNENLIKLILLLGLFGDFCLCLLRLWLQVSHCASPAFSMGSEDLNSSSLACLPSTLAAKQSLTPCLMPPYWKQIEKYSWTLQFCLLKMRSPKRLSQFPQRFWLQCCDKVQQLTSQFTWIQNPKPVIASGHLRFLYLTFLVGDFSHTTCLF